MSYMKSLGEVIPGSGGVISWNDPVFTWWNDPFGVREAHYQRDLAAYREKQKAIIATSQNAALVASANRTLAELDKIFKHGGYATPTPLTQTQLNTNYTVGAEVSLDAAKRRQVTTLVVGAALVGGFFWWKKGRP